MLCIEPVGNRKWRVFVSAETGEGETFDFRGYRSAWCTGVKYYKILAGYSNARDLTYAILQLNQQSTLQNISTIFSKSSLSSFCTFFLKPYSSSFYTWPTCCKKNFFTPSLHATLAAFSPRLLSASTSAPNSTKSAPTSAYPSANAW